MFASDSSGADKDDPARITDEVRKLGLVVSAD